MISNLSNPLLVLGRGPAPEEILVHGAILVKVQGREPQGHSNFSFLARSLLSPWQFLATECSGPEDFWSIGLALHSGQDIHMQALAQLSEAAKAGEEELFCPREYPLDWEHAAKLKFSGETPLRMHHPSSGKHLLLLAACEQFGFKKEGYWDQSHPLQKKLFALIGKEAREQVQWTYDSCGLPTFVMNARLLMQLWENFALDGSQAASGLRSLWLRNPRLVGGRGRLDSDLTLAAKGRALVKEGIDGLLLVQALPSAEEPAASCLIKIASGYHKAYLALALLLTIRKHPELPSTFHLLGEYLQSRLDEWLPHGQSLTSVARAAGEFSHGA